MKRKHIIRIIISAICILGISAGVYCGNYYHVENKAETAMETAKKQDNLALFDGGGDIGFIFYPGGKVEYSAYAPLMKALQEKGITCVLMKMPLNLAVLDSDAWMDAVDVIDGIDKWYIGGHSLGGAMASNKLDEDIFSGVVLLGAYPVKEITIPVLSIYGSLDGVMNREKYDESRDFMQGEFQEFVLEGGNHAGYGSYGQQDGDGESTITNEEQISITADKIAEFIKG